MSESFLLAAAIGALLLVGVYLVLRPSSPKPGADRKPGADGKPSAEGKPGTDEKKPSPLPAPTPLPAFDDDDDDDEADITVVTVRLDLSKESKAPGERIPTVKGTDGHEYADVQIVEIDEDLEPAAKAHRFFADDGVDEDVPTMTKDAFLVSSARQSDQGRKRKRNEDCFLVRENDGIFVVADGMGGYAGGDIASNLAATTISDAFEKQEFVAKVFDGELPRRARELAQAMQAANLAIWEQATDDPKLRGMGTTLVAARFALRKKRVFIGHVGDSRCYRFRDGGLLQLTQDHTLESVGYKGPGRAKLIRAVGIRSEVEIDIIIAEPKLGDVYLLCSDGLTKMIGDETVQEVLAETKDLDAASEKLIELALEAGGKDNVTVVLVAVKSPTEFSQELS